MNETQIETLLDERQLSRLLGVSIGALRFWRGAGKGPRFRKVGQLVRYAPSDVKAWLNSRPIGGERAGVEGGADA
jgi:predicted DNA-binding transcriptional regulator AlpA